MKKTQFLLLALVFGVVYSCRENDTFSEETAGQKEVHGKTVDVTHHDGRPFTTGASPYAKFVAAA